MPYQKQYPEMVELYFSPGHAELKSLDLSLYETYLLSRLVQALRLGVYMSRRRDGKAESLDTTQAGAAHCERYIVSAFSSHMVSDKLFPLRHTGSSMQFILERLPIAFPASQFTALNIFQLCIWRAFAFGSKENLEEIVIGQDKEPDMHKLTTTIQGWGKGEHKLSLPAYGQFQIVKEKIPVMLSSFWDLSQEISSSLAPKAAPPTFAVLYERLLSKKIPTVPRHGLMAWLLTSDFSEYGLCHPPTIRDLVDHITKSGASGPKGALKIAAGETAQSAPSTPEEVADVLSRVFGVIQNPTSQTPTIHQMAGDCKEIQGRALTVVDLEHALCKISRQETRAKAGKGRNNAVRREGEAGRKRGRKTDDRKGDSEDGTETRTPSYKKVKTSLVGKGKQ